MVYCLYHPFMVIRGMVYNFYTNITKVAQDAAMRLPSVSVKEMQCHAVLTLRWIWQHDLTAEDDTAAIREQKTRQ